MVLKYENIFYFCIAKYIVIINLFNQFYFMEKRTLFIIWGLLFAVCSPIFSQKIEETAYFKNHAELGHEVVIKGKAITIALKGTGITQFEVVAPSAGFYYLSFWMLPSKNEDGSYVPYSVSVNDSKDFSVLKPVSDDWQCVLVPERVRLKKGNNIISVSCKLPATPNVEHVRAAKTLEDAHMDTKSYASYKRGLEMKELTRLVAASVDTFDYAEGTLSRQIENPLYDYEYKLNVPLKYTFYSYLYFQANDTASISTSSSRYFTHVLELFSLENAETYSWSKKSKNGSASLNIIIPQSGFYCVRVRSYSNGVSGLCDVNINGQHIGNVPVYNYGVRCLQGTDWVYNTFTCNSTVDPMMWIEEGSAAPGVIVAYNDDYYGSGDFSWGANSRVRKQYTRPVHAVLLSAFGSYNPTGQCDLYMRCKDSGTAPIFPNLKFDDAIMSSPGSVDYNCISWSGGITSYWEWPPMEGSSFYSPNALTAFDNFYASRGLTRSGATESNSVVDLWAIVGFYGRRYTHGSVRNGADGNVHGYDWESKCGDLCRVFHPRHALSGPYYGQVVEYYVKSPSYRSQTLAEEIAEGVSRIEYVDFDDEERALMARSAAQVAPKVDFQFQTLYGKWEDVVKNTPLSNPDDIADCKEYKELLAYCQANKELLHTVFLKLEKGNSLASTKLIGDLTLSKYSNVMEKVRSSFSERVKNNSVKTYRSIKSNYTAYVKLLLSKNSSALRSGKFIDEDESAGVSYSNFKEFNISSSSEGLTVDFSLDKPATVTLNLIDLEGNIVNVTLNEKVLESGDYSYSMTADKNRVYLVQLAIDGHANVKKIMVK
jgi:hypothetical protein